MCQVVEEDVLVPGVDERPRGRDEWCKEKGFPGVEEGPGCHCEIHKDQVFEVTPGLALWIGKPMNFDDLVEGRMLLFIGKAG